MIVTTTVLNWTTDAGQALVSLPSGELVAKVHPAKLGELELRELAMACDLAAERIRDARVAAGIAEPLRSSL